MKRGILIFGIIFLTVLSFFTFYADAKLIILEDFSSENLTFNYNSFQINISNPDIIGYLPFDALHNYHNLTKDYANASYSYRVSGATFNSTGGKYGGAYSFDGINDYVNLTNPESFNFTNVSNFTISLWIYKAGNGEGLNVNGIISKRSSSFGYAIDDYFGGHQLRAGVRNSTTSKTIVYVYTDEVMSGNWNHIVFTYESNSSAGMRLYFNGNSVKNGSSIDSLDFYNDGNLLLGHQLSSISGSPGYWNGSMDEFMIFNRTLSSAEVAQIYNSTYSRFYPTGEITFNNLDLSSQGNTSLYFSDSSALNGSSFQGKINDGDWKNFSGSSFNDSDFLGNLSNVRFTVRLNSDENRFYSPTITSPYHDILNTSYFANWSELIWPPENQSDEYYGAGSNPTGNPIGGFANYSRIINSEDATYYVNTVDEFYSALNDVSPGEVIYINDSVTLDLTGYDAILISTENITIASGRGNNFSKGALLKKDIKQFVPSSPYDYMYLFRINSAGVRFTGLRFDGGDLDCNFEVHHALFSENRADLEVDPHVYYREINPLSIGIVSYSSYAEIDNSEIYGWRNAGVDAGNGAINNYYHHNYIHHNCHYGLGYGVYIHGGSTVLMEGNLFNHNRHSIASDYEASSYEARYNIQLDEKNSHDFDRHGNPGYAGNYTIIHHNSFYSYDGILDVDGIGLRGIPLVENGAQFYNNWFQDNELENSIFTLNENGSRVYPPGNVSNVTIFNNLNNLTNAQFEEPVAIAKASNYNVSINEPIIFNGSGSYKTGGLIRYYEWDFADNNSFAYGEVISHSFSEAGRYKIKLTVSDENGFLNWTYITINVLPDNSTGTYLNFWMFENSRIDSPELLVKQVIVDGEIIWTQNFSDNFSGWQHINVEIPSNLSDDLLLNITLGVLAIENYTDPLYPNVHEAELFEIYYDSVSLLRCGNDLIASEGDFESSSGNWTLVNGAAYSHWVDETSFYREMGGKYSYKIAPLFRPNYTDGTFYGISNNNIVLNEGCYISSNQNNGENLESSRRAVFRFSPEVLQNGLNVNVAKNQKVEIPVGDEKKTVKIESVSEEKVVVSVDGENYEIENSSSKKIDLNDDGFYDIAIFNNGVKGNYANLEFKLINEKIESENEQEQNENIFDEIPGAIKSIGWKIYVLVGIIFIFIWVKVFRRRKRK
jgi:hypothetical protein